MAGNRDIEYNRDSLTKEVTLMKKFGLSLFMLVMIGAIGYGVYLYAMAPHQVYCTRLVQLCELEDPKAEQACHDLLGNLTETQASAVREAATCAVEAESCPGVAGCIVGASAGIGIKEIAPILGKSENMADDFLKGLKDGAGKLFE